MLVTIYKSLINNYDGLINNCKFCYVGYKKYIKKKNQIYSGFKLTNDLLIDKNMGV